MEKERKELQRKRAETAKQQEEQRASEEREEREGREREENERKAKKRQEVEGRLRQLEEGQKKKEDEFKSQTLLLKEKMKEKTMVDKMEEQFNLKQNESLEERKKRLAEIRALHKPIDRTELDAHALKFEQMHAQRLALAQAAQPELQKDPGKAFYKSIFYQRVKEEQKIHTERREEEELGKLKEARDRLKKYAENIRTNHKPSIDEKKVEELKFRSVSHKNRSMSSVQKSETPGKIGLRYLEYSKTQIDHARLLGPATPSEPEEDKSKKLDYLGELREKNKNRGVESAQDMLRKLEKDHLPREAKARKILEFTERLEQKAKRREELEKLGVSGAVDEELDMLYLQAIEAKLNLLDDN
jgi:hypothetical protein